MRKGIDMENEKETAATGNKVTVFQVEGITCLDCAQKFEQAVKNLPGVGPGKE